MKRLVQWLLLPCALWLAVVCVPSAWAADRAAARERIGSDIQYLSSDELEGRGPGTAGLDKAEQFIRVKFANLGLRGAGNDGAYTQPFSINLGAELVKSDTFLVLHGPNDQELKLELGKQYQPLSTNNMDKMEVDLVFAGYGISAPEYDD